MALKGNLSDFNITQLLNLIYLAQKTGTLIVKSTNNTAWLFFHKGKLGYAQLGKRDNRLIPVLYRGKLLRRAQLNLIKSNRGNASDKELGLLLINANYLSQKDILNCLQKEFLWVIRKLFTWMEGTFQFENFLVPPNGVITLQINLENIILEGSRKILEWEQLRDEIPSLDIAMKFTERPERHFRDLRFNSDEWRVISYINPKNSIAQIARKTKIDDIHIRKIVYGLVQAGLVDFIRPEDVTTPFSAQYSFPGRSKEEKKSLINRIIDRIRSI